MNKKRKTELKRILADNTSGSTEIVIKINAFFEKITNDPKQIHEAIKIFKKELDHFPVVKNYLTGLSRKVLRSDTFTLINFLNEYESKEKKKYEIIAKAFIKKYPRVKTIVAISKSGTLLNVLKEINKQRKLKIIVLEARPALEGRRFAISLVNNKIKTELVVDALMGEAVNKSDAVVIGADVILKDGNVVNKIGSRALAIAANYFKKPFIVVSTKDKITRENRFIPKKQNKNEVWDYDHNNLTVKNIYFEEIEMKLISSVVTD